jgi:NAD(P)-dependent dehydrogenase (short-subunit alcohol dehydrogenase family)
MSTYQGKLAVITGGASGIGLAMARHAGGLGMSVALLDVEKPALVDATVALGAAGVDVHAFECDVADREQVHATARRIEAEVGDPWLLANNAGVFVAAPFLESTHEQWRWVLNVNLWGVVHWLEAFLPGMVARDAGHVINTSSLDGVVTVPNVASYIASKHAITGLSESIYRELAGAGSNVGISVLCPGTIETNIVRSARNWDPRLGPAPPLVLAEGFPPYEQVMSPERVAEIVFEAVAARRFWIVTHAEQYASAIRARAEGIIAQTDPDDASVDPNYTVTSGRLPH